MRPIRLSLSGINSFRQREELDFTQLESELFCIYGDTGSGKTTLLDSIILALYGDYNRSEGLDFLNLGSDLAHVEFEFAMEGSQYKVWREFSLSLSGEPRKKVKLYKDGNLIATQLTEVNKILLEVIGIDKKDFTQVIALEQGEFGKFLSSTRKERTLVVCNLFRLDRYKNLYQKASNLSKENQQKIINIQSSILPYSQYTKEYLELLVSQQSDLLLLEKENDKKLEVAAKKKEILSRQKEKYDKSTKAKARKQELEKSSLNFEEDLKDYAKEIEIWRQKTEQIREKKQQLLLEQQKIKSIEPRLKELDNCKSALESAREKYKQLLEQKNKNLQKLEHIKTQKQNLDKELNSLKKLILNYLDFQDFDEVKAKAEHLVSEFNRLIKEGSELTSIQQDNIKSEKKHRELLLSHQKAQSVSQESLQKAKQEYENYQKAYEEYLARQAAERVRLSLKEGDSCPVCGGVYLGKGSIDLLQPVSKEELGKLNKNASDIQEQLNQISGLIKQEIINIQNLEIKKKETEQKIEQNKQSLEKIKLQSLDDCKELLRQSKQAYQLYQTLNKIIPKEQELEITIKSQESQLSQYLERGTELKEQYQIILDQIGEDGQNAREKIVQLKDKVQQTEQEEKKAEDNFKKASKNHTDTALVIAQNKKEISLLEKDIIEIEFDPEQMEAAQQEYDNLIKEKGELAEKKGSLGQQIIDCQKGLQEKEKAEEKIAKLKKTSDKLEVLKKLLKGDRFLEFVADEYIKAFSQDASIILNDISGGKYSLFYKDGTFYVIDYLSGSKQRNIKTLSGGEKFLASLSLAIAIARHISQKSYDLFFLDEGFGTLDNQKIDMVTEALMQLSRTTMVGLITHRSELVQRINARVKVESATTEQGSRIIPIR